MYIIEQIEQNLESAQAGSVQETVSQYLLLHLRHVPDLSLSRLAQEIGVSKGYLSKYFSRMTNGRNYASFQNALLQEFGYTQPDVNALIRETDAIVRKYRDVYPVPAAEIKKLIRKAAQADRIILIGKSACRGVWTYFLRALWASGKQARYYSGSYLNENQDELDSVGKNDLAVIISVCDSLDDYRLKTAPTNDILDTLIRSGCRLYFAGADRTRKKAVTVLNCGNIRGEFTELELTQVLAAAVTNEFLQYRKSVHKP